MICPAKTAQELLAEFRASGRQEPFEEIVRRYAAMVFQVCFQVLANRHDAEDATQAVFLTLAVQGKTNKEIHSIGPWLQQVGKRLSLDLKKSRSRRLAREKRHGIASCNGTAGLAMGSGLDHQELRHILSEELNHLAPKYRLPLILHYFGGLSREQMSQELGCKAATLGVRLHRGREMLAARLSQRGVALSAAGLGLLLSYMVREAVTESLVWSTSHAASQMAAGSTISAGVISERAIALARGATNTLAVAKLKAMVAAVLIAATAVAAGEVVSKVRPMDLKLQAPAGERLLDLLRPKIPEFRSDATPPEQTPTAPTIAVSTNQTQVAVVQPQVITPIEKPIGLHSATGAEWGGSILASRWIGSTTSTHIPGIAWSSTPPPPARVGDLRGRGIAVGPLAAPIERQPQRILPGFRNQGTRLADGKLLPGTTQQKPPAQKPKGPAPNEQDNRLAQPPPSFIQSMPSDPKYASIDPGPRLFLGPASVDARVHAMAVPPSQNSNSTPTPPIGAVFAFSVSGNSATVSTDADFLSSLSTEHVTLTPTNNIRNTVLNIRALDSADWNLVTGNLAVSSVPDSIDHVFKIVQPEVTRPRYSDVDPTRERRNEPVVLGAPSFVDKLPLTMSSGPGLIRGYGKAQSAAELDQSGQVIADGYGQQRTLDLSAVGTIRNSTSNPRGGHNGWFAQNRGELLLPNVSFSAGVATWGEDAADDQLDLVNSVRLRADPEMVGTVRLALLAPDRVDYPALPASLKAVGLWDLDAVNAVIGDVDVTVRYDAALAADLQVASRLRLWGYDGQWELADGGSIDTTNHLIWGRLSDISYFAVAGSQPVAHAPLSTSMSGTPEPAAMLGLICAGLLISRRRRSR